ncbi:MAG TPA: neutral/alkaline non-lysosomal ceramidase N-terminal domain-containing protein [Bryobacteraceae bacterium]|nr:neutral/alkaline non-lysosomal ceramidase N-terminal domain-containing protein [Bryobacteraceae bacterium]
MRLRFFSAAMFLSISLAAAAEFKAGVARIDITPKAPIFLSGYASRTHPSTGVVHPLWAKALAIEDNKGARLVVVTTDLIGLPRTITDLVAARVLKEYGLERSRLLFNSSHTHTGPVVAPTLPTMFALSPEDRQVAEDYSRKLAEDLFTAIGAALGRLAPAQISYGVGKAHFAVNRREPTPQGMKIGVNPNGPVDPDVPVIRVNAADGSLLAILFGYACHNTTLTGEFYELSGDYAGFAQIDLERTHLGATAMFVMLCGGDQNPNPRSTLNLAAAHGRTLADEVDRVLGSTLTPLKSPIRAAFQNIELEFALHSREAFEKERKDANPARVRRAEAMLKAYDDRHPVRQTLYPIQAIRFGNALTILALGGEVVVDYSLRAKREYSGTLIVAGYSNDVMSYIPSERVLHEGGYEAVDSMIYYGQPGPYASDVEDRIFDGIHRVMKAVGLKPVSPVL